MRKVMSAASDPAAWRALAAVVAIEQLGEALEALASLHDEGAAPGLLWSVAGERGERGTAGFSAELREAAEAASADSDGVVHAAADGSGFALSWQVPAAEGWLVLAVRTSHGVSSARRGLEELIAAARIRGAALLEKRYLQDSVIRLGKSERLQRALYAIAEMAGSQLEMPEMLRGLHGIVAGLMYAENFFIALYDTERRSVRYPYFADSLDPYVPDSELEMPESELTNSLTVALIHHGHPVMGSSAQVADQLGVQFDPRQGPESDDWLGVPMLSGTLARGAIVVQSYDRGVRYTEEDRALLSYVAQHILTALDRKQQQADLERHVLTRTWELALANEELKSEVAERRRSERLQAALFRIAELSISTESPDTFYATVHGVVGELLYARNFYIAHLTDDGEALEFPYSVDERDARRPRRKLARGLTEYVLRTGKSLLADRRKVEELAAAGEVRSMGSRAVCWLGVPLHREERTTGVIVVQSYSPEVTFNQRDQELLTFVSFHIASGLLRKRAQERLIAAHGELEQRVEERTRELAAANRELRGQIGERMRAEEQLTHQALHDSLTGLPNRTRLFDRLQQTMLRFQRDPGRLFAVLFLDLDRFKVVNDSVGHLVGDELLKHAGRRIASAVRQPDTVARLGGDEFAVLVEDIHDEADAIEVAERILAALAAPMPIGGKELFTSCSIGIALASMRYERAEEMLRDADAAMYRAKTKGRSRCEVFDEGLRAQALRTLNLESDLRRALVDHSFEPFLQPIVSLRDGHRIGYEALLRWRHEHHGVLVPEDFLGIAEESGLIEPIDWQLYQRAFAPMPQLLRPHEYLCINMSARHFQSTDLVERLLGLMRDAGVAPSQLRIELTEGALLDDAHDVRGTLQALRDTGVLCQLDDFGTGYSALSYLQRYPIAAIKIDRSFISDLGKAGGPGSLAVVRAILALAQSLKIETIAEGIETQAQRDALAALGCEFGQGFLFGEPRPIQEFVDAAASLR